MSSINDLTLSDDLHDIDISNFADDDTLLKADFPIKEHSNFSWNTLECSTRIRIPDFLRNHCLKTILL